MLQGGDANFIIKHWATTYEESHVPPDMKFVIIQSHHDALTRPVQEAVLIESGGNLNSKSDWRQNAKTKLVLTMSEWDKRQLNRVEGDGDY